LAAGGTRRFRGRAALGHVDGLASPVRAVLAQGLARLGRRLARLDSEVESLLQAARSKRDGRVELVACGRRAAATFALDRSAAVLPWRRRALRDDLLETVQ